MSPPNVKRDALGRIVGGALNPSGRPKVDSELARAARELSPLALQVWRKTMEDFIAGTGSAADAIRAASDSMSRGFGKPPEFIGVSAEIGPADSEVKRVVDSGRVARIIAILQRSGAFRVAADDAERAAATSESPTSGEGDEDEDHV